MPFLDGLLEFVQKALALIVTSTKGFISREDINNRKKAFQLLRDSVGVWLLPAAQNMHIGAEGVTLHRKPTHRVTRKEPAARLIGLSLKTQTNHLTLKHSPVT